MYRIYLCHAILQFCTVWNYRKGYLAFRFWIKHFFLYQYLAAYAAGWWFAYKWKAQGVTATAYKWEIYRLHCKPFGVLNIVLVFCVENSFVFSLICPKAQQLPTLLQSPDTNTSPVWTITPGRQERKGQITSLIFHSFIPSVLNSSSSLIPLIRPSISYLTPLPLTIVCFVLPSIPSISP